ARQKTARLKPESKQRNSRLRPVDFVELAKNARFTRKTTHCGQKNLNLHLPAFGGCRALNIEY
ncbi:MAG: hypothetical protein WC951_08575, partial [Bacteroidales bacterium]